LILGILALILDMLALESRGRWSRGSRERRRGIDFSGYATEQARASDC